MKRKTKSPQELGIKCIPIPSIFVDEYSQNHQVLIHPYNFFESDNPENVFIVLPTYNLILIRSYNTYNITVWRPWIDQLLLTNNYYRVEYDLKIRIRVHLLPIGHEKEWSEILAQ